jgi:hypothetical protein
MQPTARSNSRRQEQKSKRRRIRRTRDPVVSSPILQCKNIMLSAHMPLIMASPEFVWESAKYRSSRGYFNDLLSYARFASLPPFAIHRGEGCIVLSDLSS